MASLVSQTFCFLCALVFLLQCNLAQGIKLNDDGGYEIVIALEEGTPVPEIGAESYVSNIKTTLRSFSSRLWVATKGHFYLQSADILVPSHWTTVDSSTATAQSFKTADIRLSPNVTHPRTDNPNICGEPGNFIELPSSFFNFTRYGPYGLHWKSILHSWAMYRFGVHPEHGYVGDSKYPYATWDTQANPQWTVTGCSNEPILGKFQNIANPDDSACETGDVTDDCRFVPLTTNQNATTSLMHFHWIESVTEFCDEHNHNVYAQNKQNALCDHKSVWQVIRESPDFIAVTSPRNEVPVTKLKIVKHSPTPLLYILLDRGLIQGSHSIANFIPRVLSTLLADSALTKTVAAVGAFPGNEGSPVVDLVHWSELGTNQNAFMEAVGNLRIDGPLERDFSRALVAVADKIKAANHPNGAVAVLIKYGADVQNFAKYVPESEVFNAFNEGNIIFNSIELNFPNHTGYSHLAKVAQETAGSYVTLNTFGEAESKVANVLNYVKRTLVAEYIDLRKSWKMLRKYTLATTAIVPVSSDIKGNLQIFISSTEPNLTSANFSVAGNELVNGKFALKRNLVARVSKSLDWKEQGSKFTYKLEVTPDQLEGISQLNLQILCDASPFTCASNIFARAQIVEESEVKIELSTSVVGDLADLSIGRPVSIFSKVTKNGIPVQDAVIIATITNIMSLQTTLLRLVDDGALSPDMQELDGIYSGYFAPETDGQFQLSVTVQGTPAKNRQYTSLQKKARESGFSRLLPIDQSDTGCGAGSCGSEIIDESFMQTVDLMSTFRVIQTALYKPSPSKIQYFMALDQVTLGKVTFYWQTPSIPGRTYTAVTSYDIRSAPSVALLINDFDNQTRVPLPPNFRPLPPPNMEAITIDRPNSTTYYAIRSEYRGKRSVISSFAVVDVPNTGPTENPSTTTTLETESTPGPTPTITTPNPSDPTTDSPSESPSTPIITTPNSTDSTTGTPSESTSPPTTEDSTGSSTPTIPPTTTQSSGSCIVGLTVVSTIILSMFTITSY